MFTSCIQFLPERHYITFRSSLSQIRLSSVTFMCPNQGVKTFGNISLPFCTIAILWRPYKILRRSSLGNPTIGGIKHKRGSKIEWWWTYRRLYLIPMSHSVILSPGEFLVSVDNAHNDCYKRSQATSYTSSFKILSQSVNQSQDHPICWNSMNWEIVILKH